MERRITKKIEDHQVKFKSDLQEWLKTNHYEITCNGQDKSSEFLKYMYDYGGVLLHKEDFQKRKRTKNIVSHFERCTANRANGEQCTRRKKADSCFCGTHAKGTPHGVNNVDCVETNNFKNVEVWIEEIMGINYYIDNNNNVYKHEDIVANKSSPSIIAKWEIDNQGEYIIPDFTL